ncbi:hypothetical protein T4A_2814 [Trichinella pseudospiralis]|uniref:Uncharacterized protein n=1 Tax=Trichinella pseudospiralis TaxID=6337 RepID=A0A0V1E5T4_TRIPS|nr:hypothetical protein T4A_2814 [Trichinella pseudospiralis]
MEQSKNENADDMKPITDVTKEEEQERKRAKFVICKIFFAVKQYCVVHYVEMSKEKVKTRTTRNKSQTAVLRRTRDEKRYKIVKTRSTGSGSRTTRSGSRTARSRSTEDRRYAVPRGSQFCKSGLGILRKGEVIP